MLKKPPSDVLAALRGSTYRSVRLAPSLAAALLDGLFEHPVRYSFLIPQMQPIDFEEVHHRFAQPARTFDRTPIIAPHLEKESL